MIKIVTKIPKNSFIAVSGGVDSMALFSFLANGGWPVIPVFFHHGTETSEKAFQFLNDYCNKRGYKLIVGRISSISPKKGLSLEEHWRNERYNFFHDIDGCVLTAHHLDDCVETWVWSSLHGNPKVIPLWKGNVARPLLLTEKSKLIDYCKRKNVPWIEDESNNDTKFTRNFIRHQLLPHAYKVNPGLRKVIKKKIEQQISC